jgi:hypothetical protein
MFQSLILRNERELPKKQEKRGKANDCPLSKDKKTYFWYQCVLFDEQSSVDVSFFFLSFIFLKK